MTAKDAPRRPLQYGPSPPTMRAMTPTDTQRISRLEKLLYRMEAQVACLAWAFQEISVAPGLVFEMGLAHL